ARTTCRHSHCGRRPRGDDHGGHGEARRSGGGRRDESDSGRDQEERLETRGRRRVRAGEQGGFADDARSWRGGGEDDRDADGEHRPRGGAVGPMTPRRASRGADDSDLDLFAPASPPPPQAAPPRAQKPRRQAAEPERGDGYPGETAQSAVTVSMLSQAA